jgi:hypothetical protein
MTALSRHSDYWGIRSMRSALIAGFALIWLSVTFSQSSKAQDITTFCGLSGLWETPYAPQNEDCKNSVYLRVEGEIRDGLAKRLKAAIEPVKNWRAPILAGGRPVIVELKSKGGNVLAALKAGRVLRDARVWTSIGRDKYASPLCASACTFLFIAGVNRQFEGGELELHRPSLPAAELAGMSRSDIEARNRELKEMIIQYVEDMGVDRRFVDLTYSVPIDVSIPLTVFGAREVHAAGMTDAEYDYRKGELVRELKLGANADEIFAYYLGRERINRECMERIYRQALSSGADPIDADFAASGQKFECEQRAFKAYPNVNDLGVTAEQHFPLLKFAMDN